MAAITADKTSAAVGVKFSSNWRKLHESMQSKKEDGQRKDEQKRSGRKFISAAKKTSSSDTNVEKSEPPSKRSRKFVDRKSGADGTAVEGPSGENHGVKLTKTLAMDCEYVGVGEDGMDNMVARVSLVNAYGDCVYDKYVKPTEPVTDYRTAISGIRPENLLSGVEFHLVQKEVYDMIEGCKLVGHSINNDLKVLHLSHPKRAIRDTAKYKPFKAIARTRFPSLKKLCRLVLGIHIQQGEHDSVCDARSTLQLYQLHKRHWETNLRLPRQKRKNQSASHAQPVVNYERQIAEASRNHSNGGSKRHWKTENGVNNRSYNQERSYKRKRW